VNAPDPSIGTKVSIEVEDSLFANLVEAEEEGETYANLLHYHAYGSVSFSNTCMWNKTPYSQHETGGAPFILFEKTMEAGFDIDSDLILEGNYYRTEETGGTNQSSLCLAAARYIASGNETCVAYGSGSEDVCDGWVDQIPQPDDR
jgi:hypothetical protein